MKGATDDHRVFIYSYRSRSHRYEWKAEESRVRRGRTVLIIARLSSLLADTQAQV